LSMIFSIVNTLLAERFLQGRLKSANFPSCSSCVNS